MIKRVIHLNRDADDFHHDAARRLGISLSEWFRRIPLALTKEEVELVKEYRRTHGHGPRQ